MASDNCSDKGFRYDSIVINNIPVYPSKYLNVDIFVFNIGGQRVKTITSGKHTFIYDGRAFLADYN